MSFSLFERPLRLPAQHRPTSARVPGLKVIIMTGYAGDRDATSLGGAAHELLTKPLEADRLLATIRACLDR